MQRLHTNRRLLLGGGLASLVLGLPNAAVAAELTGEKLDLLIQRTLDEPDTTPLSRPSVLGFRVRGGLTTKSIEKGDKIHTYGFMVVIPDRDDGLIFFEGKSEKPTFFAMHRTGDHLRRVASARNTNGELEAWSGREAQENFAKQKSFWADQFDGDKLNI